MKALTSLFAFALVFSAASSFASTDPQSCVKEASKDGGVLAAYKTSAKSNTQASLHFEELAIRLCGGASAAYDPIACFKATVNDPDIFPTYKGYFKGDSMREYRVEELALRLCGSNH